jgi:hypothetical protein
MKRINVGANMNKLQQNQPGYINGRHYSTYIPEITSLKQSGDYTGLETLLLEIINATEKESQIDSSGVAPAYYEELAILYRKQKMREKEIAVLERFANQKHARGVKPAQLLERLNKLKEKQK